jgi:FKBP-type peptidyl-prolyl cis-trans isomerase
MAILFCYTGYMNPSNNTPLEGTKLANFTPVANVAELQIIDVQGGTGDVVQPGATITAHYTGALVKDGTIFQSSHDFGDAVTFGLNQVIAGWTKGVPGMKVGGTRRLVIPAAQAYGAHSPAANIPPNSDLVFDIELVAIK